MKNHLGMLAVSVVGAIIWGYVMPDIVSAIVVCAVWGGAVGHFWARNLPAKKTPEAPHA